MPVWQILLSLFFVAFGNVCLAQNQDDILEPPEVLPYQLSRYNDSIEPIRYSYPDPSRKKASSRWLVVAGRKVMPSTTFRVVVQALRKGIPGEEETLTVRAALTRNLQQVAFGKAVVQPGELSDILMKVPDEAVFGKWHLIVEGREGPNQLPVFKNATRLRFSPNFLTILIQTSRPIYNAGQKVYFRAVMLTKELRPYEEPVDIFILDPNDVIVRRWPSYQPGDGVVNLNFDLPEYPLLGNWTVKVQAGQQVQNKTILVELYFKPRFEVFIRMPYTFKVTDEYVSGVVIANMTNWRDVYGNCSISLLLATEEDSPIPTKFERVYYEFTRNFSGVKPFEIPMSFVSDRVSSDMEGIVIKVLAKVGDAFGWKIIEGWALAHLVPEQAKVSFLGDQPLFFRPGMPLVVHLFVSYSDDHPFDEDELVDSHMVVTFRSSKFHEAFINGSDLVNTGGVTQIVVEVPEDSQSVDINARFVSSSGLGSSATMTAILHHSPRNRHLQVETSSVQTNPGDFIILHVRNNFFVAYLNYAVISDGIVVHSGREMVNDASVPTVTTFALTASSEMAPVAKILVWVVDQDGEVIAHSISVPVNPLGKHEAGISWNEHKDHTGGSAEINFEGETNSYFASSSVWEETHYMDSGHEFDEARILYHMIGFHESSSHEMNHVVPHIRMASTRHREGAGKQVRFFPTPNAGADAPQTFNFSDAVLLTDAVIYYHPSKETGAPGCEWPRLHCFTGSCYMPEQRCDGRRDCPDASDEAGCKIDIDPKLQFRLYRLSRIWRFYDPIDGDWAWQDHRIVGSETQVYPIPKRPQHWVFSMFAVGRQLGLGLLQERKMFDSAGPFMLTLETPAVARMWEQVGLNVGIFNFHNAQVGVLVTIPYSEDYMSILVEKNGVVESYNPRRAHGVFQHVVWLGPGESKDVQIPIIFTRMGSIEINVVGSTQMMTDADSRTIEVVPEGCPVRKHTSILLDLRNRALVYEFFDIDLDEVPIVPYTLDRKFIFGTPQGDVTLVGDIVGPAFPEVPVSAANMLGIEVMGAETHAYNFGANIWSLHYLRLTNQLEDEVRFEVLKAVNVEYASLVRYQLPSGGFTNYIGSEPSVWLTAHALRTLYTAIFQDWENEIFIDNRIFEKGIRFLMKHQTEEGSFMETPFFFHPLDAKVDPKSRVSWDKQYQNISLTAHVLMAISDVMKSMEGDLHRQTNLVKQKATKYLELLLETIIDPYELAVTSWALTKADSSEKELAFSQLDQIKRVSGDRIYWSRTRIETLPIIYEDSQRPYLQPRPYNEWDAHSVESTSYALLVYLKREGITLIQESIIRWLAIMRDKTGGQISTVDSLVALEALVEYSYRARIRDITNMDVWIEQAAKPNASPHHFHITNEPGISELRSFELERLWGHLTIVAKGQGQGLLQMEYTYGVDVEAEKDYPPMNSYEINVLASYTGRNNSYIDIRSCQRWIHLNESETSGLTVVEIHLPSGYYVMQDELMAFVATKQIRNLRWALRTDSSVKFFFNYLDAEEICFSYQLERWYPVANLSRFNQIIVYELFQPERFQMELFEVHVLYSLDICEVCGSYQCPYCPYYSHSNLVIPRFYVLFFLSLLLVTVSHFKLVKFAGGT